MSTCIRVTQSSQILFDPMDGSLPGSSIHGIFQTGVPEVCCHFLLQGIFLTQGSNLSLLCLLHWQVDSLPLAPPGKPNLEKIMKQVRQWDEEWSWGE